MSSSPACGVWRVAGSPHCLDFQCTALSPQLLVALKSVRCLAVLGRALFVQPSAFRPPGSPRCRLSVACT